MSTPEPNSAPEGQENTDADDEAAQQALAALAAQEPPEGDDSDGDDDDADKFDESKARKRIEKITREAKNLRDRIRQLEPLAKEAETRRKGEMTEAQRLAEEKAQLEVELAELRTSVTRREAAEKAGLAPEFLEFITAAEPEEALAQAKRLAKAMGGTTAKPQPDFRQGARGSSNSGNSVSSDDLIRQMAGRGR